MKKISLFASFVIISESFINAHAQSPDKTSGFVTVKNTGFQISGKPYYFLGTNFWYGLNLGSKGAGGNRERLIRELDRLKAMGVTNLRIMGGSEGPDTEPYRMVPALQTAAGEYNKDIFDGLDFLLNEMKKRDMYAVVCLNDFWNWSGGMGQYIVWSGTAKSIPYPPPAPGGDWGKYQQFTAQFYSNQKAMDMFNDFIRIIVNRKNNYSGIEYKADPTIMAWELANEPRGINNKEALQQWIDNTAGLIKKLDHNHLVTTGSEGTTSSPYAGTDPQKDHSSPNIDYITIHIWVQNWNFYDPARADATYGPALQYALKYLNDHEQIARKMNKPVVLEEFGISRDQNNYDPQSPTTIREKYYTAIFDAVYKKANQDNSVFGGCNFWAWAGEGRPKKPGGLWKPNDDFIGDPPHESQGWYSIYDTDTATIEVIKEYAEKMNSISR